MKKLIILCLTLVFVFSMAGCGQKIEKITDFERFDSMTNEADRIDVAYDNNRQHLLTHRLLKQDSECGGNRQCPYRLKQKCEKANCEKKLYAQKRLRVQKNAVFGT